MRKIVTNSRYVYVCFSIMLMLCLAGIVKAQTFTGESGIPIQKEFLPTDYKAGGQNFAITADKRGVLYFANFSGVLEYDGANWRTILTKERTKVNTLVTDANGRIYVGTRGEIGYLRPNALGDMQFVSLNSYLKPYKISAPDVLSSYVSKEGIYFITANQIMLWNGKKLKVQSIGSPLINAFYVNEKLYVQLKFDGLKIFANGRFINVPGGSQFSEQVTVNAMVPLDGQRVLVGSGNQGLFLLNAAGITPFASPANAYLKQELVSYATKLSDNSIAIGTIHGGVVVISTDGTLKQLFSKNTTGLYDNNIHYLYQDNDHGFWIATEKNITRIETPSYLTFYNNKKNVNGNVSAISRFNGKLYIATDMGLFYYNNARMQFAAVPGMQMPCLNLLQVQGKLMVATSNGVYSYDGSKAQNVMPGYSLTLYRSAKSPDQLYVGQLNGVSVLQLNGGAKRLAGVRNEVREIAEDTEGDLWFQVPSKGLIRYQKELSKATLYDQSKGLPYNSGNHINTVKGKIMIGTIKGAYQFNKPGDKFEHVYLFKGDSATNNTWITQMVESKDGTLWTTSGNGTDINSFKNTARGYEAINQVLATIKDEQVFDIYPDDNGLGIWLGGADKLMYFDTRYTVRMAKVEPVLIRSVKVNTDSVLFSGTYFDAKGLPVYTQNKTLIPALSYQDNNISFAFSSPSATGGDIQYRYFLDGFDTDTTTWTNTNVKEYSNLPAGKYTFRVTARDMLGFKSREAAFAFSIAKPLYQTIWAYIIYLVVLSAIIFVVARFRSRKLLSEKLKLEELIRERTAEVVVQKEAIENQTKQLAGKNDELEKINLIVKSINAEIDFDSLLQAILEKAKIIRGAEKAAMLVYDKPTNSFKFKASYGYNTAVLDHVQISAEDAQTRYLSAAEEIYEDIYVVRSVKSIKNDAQLASVNRARSSLMMVIKLNHEIHAYMIMENWQKRNAFEERDFSLLKNLKEHFVAAVIKTTLLEDIQDTLTNLKNTQEQLIRQEKLASIGQLTKGIVDRILNPLNYINNFSSLSGSLIDESLEYIEKPELNVDDKEEVVDLLVTVKSNMQKVHDHGASASRIVKGMEKILREKSTYFVETDLNKLLETSLKQVLIEGRKEFPDVEVSITTDLDKGNENAEVLLSEMNTVFNNLLINAYYTVAERHHKEPGHQPEIIVSTKFSDDEVEIRIRDNGKGISVQERKQLFSPFFTTKPTSKGTGLGLYLSQDIIKEHNGAITVRTEEGSYTEFTVRIPKLRPKH